MEDPWPTAAFVFLAAVFLSGFFPFFDFSLAACRKARLQKELALKNPNGKNDGRRLYERLLKTVENPAGLLLAGRICASLLRVFASFWAGLAFAGFLQGGAASALLQPAAALPPIAAAILAVLVLGAAAFLLGELFPAFLARTFCAHVGAEKTAAFLLLPATLFALPLRPLVFILERSGASLSAALKLETPAAGMTEDELRQALEEGEKSGIVESRERSMVEGVFYLGDRPIRAFMTHRSEIHWIDVNAPAGDIRANALAHRAQRCFPVADGGLDEIVGAVYLEDIILDSAEAAPQGIRAIMTKPHFVPETMSAVKAFESFKKSQVNFLFVMDEYGGLAGIISSKTLLEKIVGDMSVSGGEEKLLLELEGGGWLADGHLNIDEVCAALPLFIDKADFSNYHTIAGFVLSLAGELPGAGDSFEYGDFRFLVKSMNGKRIDKILIEKVEQSE
ncbi:MAG: hemolysin family protein [Spirochaetes bacterium]|nr:hemolysin family protein [Spirochaetota bacterium]